MAVMTDELGTRRAQALSAAVEHTLVSEREPVVGLLDIRGIEHSATALRAAFATPGVEITHTFAVKAARSSRFWRCSASAASARRSPARRARPGPRGRHPGQPHRAGLPAKTVAELREALAQGIAVNADNRRSWPDRRPARQDALRVAGGIRVNPQVGGGSIEAMSTATATSKFGWRCATRAPRNGCCARTPNAPGSTGCTPTPVRKACRWNS